MAKVLLLSFLLIFVIGGIALGQSYSICNYEPARNELTSVSMGGEYHRFNDRRSNGEYDSSMGSLMLSGITWSQGQPWSYNLAGAARLTVSQAGVELDQNVRGDAQVRRYLSERHFAFGGLDTSSLLNQNGPTISALVGGGMGRFINVTPMAKALGIASILEAQGLISADTADSLLPQMADLIGRQTELGNASILEELESLTGQRFGVSSVLILREVLDSGLTRYCGWEGSLGIGYDIYNPNSANEPFVLARASYARPLDNLSRVLVMGRGRIPLPLTSVYRVGLALDYTRLLSASTDFALSYTFVGESDASSSITQVHTIDSTIRMQLQRNLSVTTRAHLSTGTEFDELEWGLDLGFMLNLY